MQAKLSIVVAALVATLSQATSAAPSTGNIGGDSIATAATLPLGVTVGGSLDRMDFWSLQLHKGDSVVVDLQNTGGGSIFAGAQVCFMRPEVTDFQLAKTQCYMQDNQGDTTYGLIETTKTVDEPGLWTVIAANPECINNFNVEMPCYHHLDYLMSVQVKPVKAPVAIPEPPGVGLVAVAGDSYAAGVGTQGFLARGGGCHRTSQAWANFLPYAVVNVACSGARIGALFSSFQGQPPQLKQIQAARPDAVVLMIGGNDALFGAALHNCFLYSCASGKLNQNSAAIAKLDRQVAGALVKLAKALPGVKIFLAGYPRIFPKWPQAIVNCGWLGNGERLALNQMGMALQQAEADGVDIANGRLGKKRVRFISTMNALEGHELCSRSSWVFKINFPACIVDVRCGHPTAPGQEALAEVIGKSLQNQLS